MRRNPIPPGCVEVFEVFAIPWGSNWFGRETLHIIHDEAAARIIRDLEYKRCYGRSVKVSRRAAMIADGRYYFVNILPAKIVGSADTNKRIGETWAGHARHTGQPRMYPKH